MYPGYIRKTLDQLEYQYIYGREPAEKVAERLRGLETLLVNMLEYYPADPEMVPHIQVELRGTRFLIHMMDNLAEVKHGKG